MSDGAGAEVKQGFWGRLLPTQADWEILPIASECPVSFKGQDEGRPPLVSQEYGLTLDSSKGATRAISVHSRGISISLSSGGQSIGQTVTFPEREGDTRKTSRCV